MLSNNYTKQCEAQFGCMCWGLGVFICVYLLCIQAG